MMIADKIKAPKAPQTATELLQAEVLRVTADNNELRAKLAARDSADAARNAIPAKRYLKLRAAAREAGVDYSRAWKWHNRGELDSYKIAGTCEIMAEVNDLIARRMRTGRHAKASQRKR
jgi:hypothetical protein